SNLKGFLADLRKKKVDVRNAKVLVLTSSEGEPLKLKEARGGNDEHPLEHAVLELDGQIYDFDFTSEASPVSVQEYFMRMFDASQPILIKQMYASPYLEAVRKRREESLAKVSHAYPAQRLSDYLKIRSGAADSQPVANPYPTLKRGDSVRG